MKNYFRWIWMHFHLKVVPSFLFYNSWLIFLIFTERKSEFLARVWMPVEVVGAGQKPVWHRGQRQVLLLHLRSMLPSIFTISGRGGGAGPRPHGAAWRWRWPSCRSQRCRRSSPTHVFRIPSPPYCWSQVLTVETVGRQVYLRCKDCVSIAFLPR